MLISADALVVLVAALILDALVGDPDRLWRRIPHPVVLLGRLIGAGDRWVNRESWPEQNRRDAGIAWLGIVVCVAALAGFVAESVLRALPGGPLWVAAAASVLLAQRSLYQHVSRVRAAFGSGGVPAARAAVSAIVGRDTARLDEAGVSRAAIESAAENFSDGVVAPALFFAILGLPGLLAYKAVNTADSMIGHLSARHRAFGWAAARLDDALNLLPARLSAALLAAAAPLTGSSPARAIRIATRDAGLHRSPNAGWPESAMAGALGLALGGPRIYAAGRVNEPFLNPDGRRDADQADIGRALRVLLGACLLHGAAYGVAAILSLSAL